MSFGFENGDSVQYNDPATRPSFVEDDDEEVRSSKEQIDEPECVKSATVSGCAIIFRLEIDARTTAMQF